MKRTLLDLTQNILSALNADEVNSIKDTNESAQVAEIIKTTYYNILGRAELPEHEKLFQLTSSGDITKPTLMYRPNEGVAKLNWIQYFNTSFVGSTSEGTTHDLDLDLSESDVGLGGESPPAFQNVEILPNYEFLSMVNSLDTSLSNVGSFIFNDQLYKNTEILDSFTINFRNDKQPQFCTLIQNYYFIFDSYDNTQDTILQSSKTMCSGFITPSWQAVDTFIPDLDDWAVPLLLNEAKAAAFYELKQTIHPHAEREIDRQWVALQKTKSVVNKPSWFDQLPNFGRRRWWP